MFWIAQGYKLLVYAIQLPLQLTLVPQHSRSFGNLTLQRFLVPLASAVTLCTKGKDLKNARRKTVLGGNVDMPSTCTNALCLLSYRCAGVLHQTAPLSTDILLFYTFENHLVYISTKNTSNEGRKISTKSCVSLWLDAFFDIFFRNHPNGRRKVQPTKTQLTFFVKRTKHISKQINANAYHPATYFG